MAAVPDTLLSEPACEGLTLHMMCANGTSVDAIRAQIALDPAAVLVQDSDKNLPLHWACFNNSDAAAEIISLVIDAAPEAANHSGQYGRLALHTVCANSGSPEAVRTVLAANRDALLIPGAGGGFPLHWACFNQTDAVAEIITIVFEAAPQAVHQMGEYGLPLHIVCAHSGSVDVMKKVLSHSGTKALWVRGINDDLPIHWACCNQTDAAIDIIQTVLHGAPDTVREVGQDGRLPLHVVCAHSTSREAVRVVWKQFPAALQMKEIHCNLPLHCACWNKMREGADIVKEMIQAQPSAVSVAGEDGRLPLHIASADGNSVETVVAVMSAYPEALYVKDTNSNLPVHWACYNQTEFAADIAKVLLEAAPDTATITAERGRTPLHCACCNETDAALGIVQIVIQLAPHTLRVLCQYGRLPLHAACAHSGSAEAVRTVLQAYPAAVHVQDVAGGLPLHRTGLNRGAAAADIARLVLDAAPEALHLRDTDGNLPLDVARDNAPVHAVFQEAMEAERAKAEAELLALCEGEGATTKTKKKKIRKNQSEPALSLATGHGRCRSGSSNTLERRQSYSSAAAEFDFVFGNLRESRESGPPEPVQTRGGARTPKEKPSPPPSGRPKKATVVECDERWAVTRLLANEAVVAAIGAANIDELASVCEVHAVMADKQLLDQARALRKQLKEKQRKWRRKVDKVEKSVQLLKEAVSATGDAVLEGVIQEAERLVTSEAAAGTELSSLLEALRKKVAIETVEQEVAAVAQTNLAAAPEADAGQISLEEDDALCVICVDKLKEMLLFPCGHKCSCPDCAQLLMQQVEPLCPICRNPIQATCKVYD